MATRIAQRLIAAGASPERAAAFERQFAATRPGLAPKKLEDAFDQELGAIAQSIWPNTFRPPALDDPTIDSYITGVYGQNELNKIEAGAWQKQAPKTLSVWQRLTEGLPEDAEPPQPGPEKGLDAYIVWSLIKGVPAGDLQKILQGGNNTEEERNFALSYTGNLLPSDVNTLINSYAREFSGLDNARKTARKNFLKNDKYYSAGLPHPSLKYGETTDLAKGIIDYRTNPTVERVLKDPKQFEKFTAKRAGVLERSRGLAARAGDALSGRELRGIEQQFATEDPVQAFEKDVFKSFTESYKGTPFFDEVQRRESVKGKTIK